MDHDSTTRDKAAKIVEVALGSRQVSLIDDMLAIAGDEEKIEHFDVNDVAGIVARRPGPSWSATALAALTERSIGIVMVGSNHDSKVLSWPVPTRKWTARIRAQLSLYPPLARSLLGQLEAARRAQRALALATMGRKKNLDAIAAAATAPLRGGGISARHRLQERQETEISRHYWPWLAGPGFRRDSRKAGANSVINYGHTQLRILATQAVHDARLHPGISLRGRHGSGGLADDLAIPFRPIVDLAAAIFTSTGNDKVNERVETAFARLLNAPLRGKTGLVQIKYSLGELANSMAHCFETGEARLSFQLPAQQTPDSIFGLVSEDQLPRVEADAISSPAPTGRG